ncbi:hypothetical protein [Planococcus lenghuensis]|uniref:Uncharacterized protein n=1 Tax=Planococcus lenghuensis TaxID=2213202 RepID=A0A1Q2KYP1_9BACL|nr:hypothetical protein [Planococcus lenghuensis]AQQ53309.1 hypothetical protein B0X71_09615 [Planococcus lenghuensis]
MEEHQMALQVQSARFTENGVTYVLELGRRARKRHTLLCSAQLSSDGDGLYSERGSQKAQTLGLSDRVTAIQHECCVK